MKRFFINAFTSCCNTNKLILYLSWGHVKNSSFYFLNILTYILWYNGCNCRVIDSQNLNWRNSIELPTVANHAHFVVTRNLAQSSCERNFPRTPSFRNPHSRSWRLKLLDSWEIVHRKRRANHEYCPQEIGEKVVYRQSSLTLSPTG